MKDKAADFAGMPTNMVAFLRGMLEYGDKVDLVWRLTSNREQGLRRVREVLEGAAGHTGDVHPGLEMYGLLLEALLTGGHQWSSRSSAALDSVLWQVLCGLLFSFELSAYRKGFLRRPVVVVPALRRCSVTLHACMLGVPCGIAD